MSTSLASIHNFGIFRHSIVCRPGLWLINLSLGFDWAEGTHVHAHCVVDDFGTLQTVAFSYLTATGEVHL